MDGKNEDASDSSVLDEERDEGVLSAGVDEIEIGQPIPYENDSREAHIIKQKTDTEEQEDPAFEFPRIEGWMLKEKQGKTSFMTMGLVTRSQDSFSCVIF